MTHCGTHLITTERLYLRRFTIADADAMYQNWACDDAVTKYLMWSTHQSPDTTRSLLADWVKRYANDNYYHWAIVLRENGAEPIGDIAVVAQDEAVSMVHIGYCIGQKWWHRGITSEALAAVIDYLFEKAGAARIEARHDPRNPHSGAVMQKCGMRYEGTLRRADWNNQGICDACYYGLLREEWQK